MTKDHSPHTHRTINVRDCSSQTLVVESFDLGWTEKHFEDTRGSRD
jgi:hypothetical protein